MTALIKERRYDKRLDEYKQNECVICVEDFKKGDLVKKIPICHHVFHTKCIEGWFKSKQEELSHKCPLCNCEINEEKLKEALKKEKEERRAKKN